MPTSSTLRRRRRSSRRRSTRGDGYPGGGPPALFAPILDHLRDVAEARSSRELEHHFSRHLNVTGVTTACEYLADRQMIGKVSAPVRLTKKSNIEVQELAFFYLTDTGTTGPSRRR